MEEKLPSWKWRLGFFLKSERQREKETKGFVAFIHHQGDQMSWRKNRPKMLPNRMKQVNKNSTKLLPCKKLPENLGCFSH
jgi:hypothetical protein